MTGFLKHAQGPVPGGKRETRRVGNYHDGILPDAPGIRHFINCLSNRGVFVRRVRNNNIIFFIKKFNGFLHGCAVNMRLGCKFGFFQVLFDYITTLSVTVNKVHPPGTPADGFNTESAAAGKQIEHERPVVRQVFQHGENSPTDEVGSRPDVADVRNF